MITVLDYGSGNVSSVVNMLRKIGVSAIISSQQEDILNAEKLIIPGVGAFDQAMLQLHELNLINPLNEVALKKKIPILGICVGMQLFAQSSEEGKLPGLGWLEAKVVQFKFPPSSRQLKVPHIGWNHVIPTKLSGIFKNCEEDMRFYFVHSYHVECSNPSDVAAKSIYGYEFSCMVQSNNIFGVQFHPEKSHKYGMKLLENFLEIDKC